MKKVVKLDKFAEAVIWWNELPDLATLHGECDRRYFQNSSFPPLELPSNRVAVEWLIPLGPLCIYGMLGARIFAEGTGVDISVINECPSRLYDDSIASKVSECSLVGITKQFQESAIKGMRYVIDNRTVPSCSILIEAAVVGEVGSCDAMFENLGEILLQLLLEPKLPNDEQLRNILTFRKCW